MMIQIMTIKSDAMMPIAMPLIGAEILIINSLQTVLVNLDS